MSTAQQQATQADSSDIVLEIDNHAQEEAILEQYELPPSLYFLQAKAYVPLHELADLCIVPDKKGRMTIKGIRVLENGKRHKASSFLKKRKPVQAPVEEKKLPGAISIPVPAKPAEISQ